MASSPGHASPGDGQLSLIQDLQQLDSSKSPRRRTRVTRACDSCKKRKARCTGTLPCILCLRLGIDCQYDAAYARGRQPAIPVLSESARLSDLELTAQEPPIQQQQSLRNSPEPPQDDLDGHYVGPSSGLSFLLRAQKRVHESVNFEHTSSIFTFGDAPLPKGETAFFEMPPKQEAQNLVAHYFDYAYPTHRFLHRPTIEKWLEDFYASFRAHVAEGAREKRALLLIIMASAKQFSKDDTVQGEYPESAYFFAASDNCLNTETGRIRLTSVQARLAQCYYLITQSRINHCWSLFGTTVRLAFAIGLHRKRRSGLSGTVDRVEEECRRRTFWCAYSLDAYLSAALGRPRSIHDSDIDQELPSDVDDPELSTPGISTYTRPTQSIMFAPIYHVKLSRIIGLILNKLYGIERLSTSAQILAAADCETQLVQWRTGITDFLDHTNKSWLKTLYQRQHTVLNLASAHAEVLLYRPILLRTFAARTDTQDALRESVDRSVEKCVQAAARIVSIVRQLCADQKLIHALWFTLYYAFCAVVVLYIYVIQRQSDERCQAYLEAAEQCQRDLATCAQPNSFVQRCGAVLSELRMEALKRIGKAPRNGTEAVNTIGNLKTTLNADLHKQNRLPLQATGPFPAINHMELSDTTAYPEQLYSDFTPSSFAADWPGWENLDSFVIAGAGSFEHQDF